MWAWICNILDWFFENPVIDRVLTVADWTLTVAVILMVPFLIDLALGTDYLTGIISEENLGRYWRAISGLWT